MGLCCSCAVKTKSGKGPFFTTTYVYGVEAAEGKWPKTPTNSLNEVTEHRRFEWLFTTAQQKQLNEWVRNLTRKHRAIHGLQAVCDAPVV
jgi:hypothetical protein